MEFAIKHDQTKNDKMVLEWSCSKQGQLCWNDIGYSTLTILTIFLLVFPFAIKIIGYTVSFFCYAFLFVMAMHKGIALGIELKLGWKKNSQETIEAMCDEYYKKRPYMTIDAECKKHFPDTHAMYFLPQLFVIYLIILSNQLDGGILIFSLMMYIYGISTGYDFPEKA